MKRHARIVLLFDSVLNLTGSIFGIAIAALIVLMSADIVIRFFGVGTLPWIIEITEYVLSGGTFLAAAWVLRQGAHVQVDILLVSLPFAIRHLVGRLNNIIGCVVSGVFLYFSCVAVTQSWSANSIIYKSLWVPEWIVLAPVPFGCLLLLIEFGFRLLKVGDRIDDLADPLSRGAI